MNAFEEAAPRLAAVIRLWAARIAGTLMFLLFLAFFFREGSPELAQFTSAERLQALALAALFFGLPIAWKRRSAAVSVLAALAVFLLLNTNEISGRPPLLTPSLHPDNGRVGN